MTRTPLISTNENGKVEKSVAFAHSGKGFNGFFAAIEKLKAEKNQQSTIK